MPRPTKIADPRGAILEAARALLLRDGHARVSLRSVAQRAGFGAASVYAYFDNKEALLAALSGQAAGALNVSLERVASKARDPEQAVVLLGLEYIRFARENPEDFMLLFTHLPSKRRALRQGVPADSAYGVLAAAVRRVLGQRGRKVAASTVDTWAYGLWATVHGMAMLQGTHLHGFKADFDSADRKVLKALVQGWVHNT